MLSFNQLIYEANKQYFKLDISFLDSAIIYLEPSEKTTNLLKLIADIKKTPKGTIILKGKLINKLQKPYCCYVGINLALKQELTVIEHINFWTKLYNTQQAKKASIIYFNLADILDKKIKELSLSAQKKVALLRLMLSNSDLWLIDELDKNLDENTKDLISKIITTKASAGGIVFFSANIKFIPEAIKIDT